MTIALIEPRAASPLPKAIRNALSRIGRRLRAVGLTRGSGTVLLVLAGAIAAGMAADLAFVLPIGLRWAIWAAGVAAASAALGLGVARPLFRRVGRADLAALAERQERGGGERLVSAVELLAGKGGGSPELIEALAGEAEKRSEGLSPSRTLSIRGALGRLAMGVVAFGAVVGPGIFGPKPLRAALERAVAPWRDVERVGRFVVEARPGDKVVAKGADVAFSGVVRPRFGSAEAPLEAWLEWTEESGAEHRSRMAADSEESAPERSFALTLPRVAGSFSYRVVTGSARSDRHRIAAVDPPSLTTIEATVEPPSYTKRPTSKAENPARIEAWEGSRVTLRATSSKPAKSVVLAWPAPKEDSAGIQESSVAMASNDGTTWTATVEATTSGTYALAIRDEYDLAGAPGPLRRVAVRADRAPSVAFAEKEGPKESNPGDRLAEPVSARDDLAVASAELHYAIKRGKSASPAEDGKIAITLRGLGSPRAEGEAGLDLKPLDLEPGDALAYRVRVVDSKPGPKGPNEAWTEVRGLSIVAKADSMIARKAAAERSEIQAQLDAIKALAAANRRGAEALRYVADAALRGNGAWDGTRARELLDREAGAREAIEKLETLARTVDDHPTFQPLARPARQIARVEAEGGRERLEASRKAADPARRLAGLQQADDRLAATMTRVDELQKLFDALGRADEDRRKLMALAAREDDLAARAAEAAGDRAKLEEIRNAQEQAARDLDELAKKSPELKAEILDAQARAAAELAEKARQLAEKQRAEARKTAAIAGGDPRIRALLEEQRALEDDARRLAMKVDRPLQEEGRSRLDAETLRRAEEPLARGDVGEGKQALERGEDVLRRLASEIADVRDDPKALARRLARRQEMLRDQVDAANRDAFVDREHPTPRERENLADRLRPLLDREQAIGKLAAAIPVPDDQKGRVAEATRAVDRAAENLKAAEPKEARQRQDEAVNALNRLAEAIPDFGRRREVPRQVAGQSKQRVDEVSREVERHLRETAPQGDRNRDPIAADIELARRLGEQAGRQDEAAKALEKLAVEPAIEPQRDRAARRARELADALAKARDEVPKDPKAAPAKAAADWHLLGPMPLDAKPPFNVAGPIDLKAIVEGKNQAKVTWKPVNSGQGGLINLGEIYSKADNQSAFGVAELTSPHAGRGQLLMGSDDTLIVWLNGKEVFRHNDSRSFQAESNKVDVDVLEGPNRVVARCGTGNGEWMFAVTLRPPSGSEQDPGIRLAHDLRRQLPALRADAQAAADRLERALQNRQTADDLAAELAAEAKALEASQNQPGAAEPAARAEAVEEQRRLAAALRDLEAPDAKALQDEAVRAADRATKALAEPKPGAPDAPREAVREAARAADALARRLRDALPANEHAAALARAQRGLDAPDATNDAAAKAQAEHEIADQAARLPDPKAAEQLAHAAEAADQAAQGGAAPPAGADPAEAARSKAAEALDAVAARGDLPEPKPARAEKPPTRPEFGPVPADPDLAVAPEDAAEARELARRERKIKERLQAVLGERIAPQDRLRAEAADLGKQLAGLRDQAKEVSPRSHWPAQVSADEMGRQAPEAQRQAVEQLARGQAPNARESQRRAAENLERAAQHAEDLAAALRADRPAEAAAAQAEGAGEGQGEAPESGLADARDAQREAARQLAQAAGQGQGQGQGQPNPAEAAAGASAAMKQAAEGLRAAAQPPRPGPGEPGEGSLAGRDGPAQPGTNPADPRSNPAGRAEPDLAALQASIRSQTGRAWGELPGHLRSEILQMSKGRYRDDYARLIRLYFREIAADSNGPRSKP